MIVPITSKPLTKVPMRPAINKMESVPCLELEYSPQGGISILVPLVHWEILGTTT